MDRANRDSQKIRSGPAERDGRSEPGQPAAAPEDGRRGGRWSRRLRNPATGLPLLWVEAVLLVTLYYTYTATRGAADSSEAGALNLGWDILHLQERLHLDIELTLNEWLQAVPPLAVLSCYYYATLHFVVTPALLVWMYRRHPGRYIRARWTLVFTTLISLCGFFLFPTAPPRLLPGTSYVDTMSHFEAWGWWSGGASAAPDGLEGLANQYAAMPSLHCAWALWCGFLLARFARRRFVRNLGYLYPVATVLVVMATANHYILDAVAGWAVLGVSAMLAGAVTTRHAGRRNSTTTPGPGAERLGTERLGQEPTRTEPTGSEPAEVEPAEVEPAEVEPADSEPVGGVPAGAGPRARAGIAAVAAAERNTDESPEPATAATIADRDPEGERSGSKDGGSTVGTIAPGPQDTGSPARSARGGPVRPDPARTRISEA